MGQVLSLPEDIDTAGSRLKAAAKAGDLKVVREIVGSNRGFDDAAKVFNWSKPVLPSLASLPGSGLVRGPEDPSLNDGETPLVVAAKGGHVDVVRLLLSTVGCDANLGDKHEQTGLMHACKQGNKEVVTLFLRRAAAPSSTSVSRVDVMKGDCKGRTCIHHACIAGQLEVVQLLCSTPGLDVNRGDLEGTTPLLAALYADQLSVLEHLVGLAESPSTMSPDRVLVVPLLDVNRGDDKGVVPLLYAAREGKLAALKLLAAHPSIEPNKEDNDGQTALAWAASNGSSAVICILVAMPKIDIAKKNAQGLTAKDYAERADVKHLLERALKF